METIFYLISFCVVFGVLFVLFAEYVFAAIDYVFNKKDASQNMKRARARHSSKHQKERTPKQEKTTKK